jgi:hypothetical protein
MYEIVNVKDGSRMSRARAKGSSTIFDTKNDADEWMKLVGLSSADYAIRPAKEEE